MIWKLITSQMLLSMNYDGLCQRPFKKVVFLRSSPVILHIVTQKIVVYIFIIVIYPYKLKRDYFQHYSEISFFFLTHWATFWEHFFLLVEYTRSQCSKNGKIVKQQTWVRVILLIPQMHTYSSRMTIFVERAFGQTLSLLPNIALFFGFQNTVCTSISTTTCILLFRIHH